jgi:hypothetical protein
LIVSNDPDAYRLLVAQNDFENLLQQFFSKDEARVAMEAMDSYVDAIQERNALLVDYNSLVNEYLGVAGEINKTRTQKNEIAELKANAAQPNLPAEAAFVTALYNRTREQCIEHCYLASRAYRFWTLQPDTALYETLKLGAPNEVNYQVLSGMRETLYTNRMKKIVSDLQRLVQHFPPPGSGLSRDRHQCAAHVTDPPGRDPALAKKGGCKLQTITPDEGFDEGTESVCFPRQCTHHPGAGLASRGEDQRYPVPGPHLPQGYGRHRGSGSQYSHHEP